MIDQTTAPADVDLAAWRDGYAAALADLADGIAHWQQFGVPLEVLEAANALLESSSTGWYCDRPDHAAPSCQKRQAPEWRARFEGIEDSDAIWARP